MKYTVSLSLVLYGTWLLWSGHYTPLLLSFGVLSCVVVVAIARRMRIVDQEGAPVELPLRMLSYLPWLLWEIVKSNVDVARRIIELELHRVRTILDLLRRAIRHLEGHLAGVFEVRDVEDLVVVGVGFRLDDVTIATKRTRIHALDHDWGPEFRVLLQTIDVLTQIDRRFQFELNPVAGGDAFCSVDGQRQAVIDRSGVGLPRHMFPCGLGFCGGLRGDSDMDRQREAMGLRRKTAEGIADHELEIDLDRIDPVGQRRRSA